MSKVIIKVKTDKFGEFLSIPFDEEKDKDFLNKIRIAKSFDYLLLDLDDRKTVVRFPKNIIENSIVEFITE